MNDDDWLYDDDDDYAGGTVNPANGLPMIPQTPVDVGGNTYGTNDVYNPFGN